MPATKTTTERGILKFNPDFSYRHAAPGERLLSTWSFSFRNLRGSDSVCRIFKASEKSLMIFKESLKWQKA